MADNLIIHKQINDVLKARTRVLSVHNDMLRDQVALAGTLNDALTGADPEELVDRFTEIREALNDVSRTAERTGQSVETEFRRGARGIVEAKKETGGFLGALKKVAKAPVVIGTAFMAWIADTSVKVVKLLWHTSKGLLGTFSQIASSVWNVGKAIVALPLRVFQGLLDLSDELAQRWYVIFQTFEDQIRRPFGDFAEDVSRSIRTAIDAMGGLAVDAGFHGFNLYTVFQDMGSAASWLSEQFQALGSVGSLLGGQIADLGIDFVLFQKGLGLTGEEIRLLGERAIASGRPLRDVLSEISNVSLQMSEAFGYSGKLIARDMGRMARDVTHFGNLSISRLGEVAVRARSLGLEVESLAKVVDRFLTFDDAAEGAAKLAQAFGVNVDVMTLMNEASQGGMGALDELRRAFFEAGRDAESMSLVQLRLLSQNTGLTEAEARLAFAMKNRGQSMEEIAQSAAYAEAQELSQVDVLNKLADATERYIRFIDMKDGLFDRFVQGFGRGILYNNQFLSTMLDLRKVSEEVWWAAFRLGRVFVDAFKPVSQMLTGLNMIYDPRRYREFTRGLTQDFEDFFEYMSDPRTTGDAFEFIVRSLRNRFAMLWDNEGTRVLVTGISEAMSRVGEAIGGALPYLAEQVAVLMRGLGSFIRGERTIEGALVDGLKEAGMILMDGFRSLTRPIGEGLQRAWNSGVIQGSIVHLLDSMATFIRTWADSPETSSAIGESFVGLMSAVLELTWKKAFRPGLSWMFDKTVGWIGRTGGKILGAISNVFAPIKAIEIAAAFAEGLGEGFGKVEDVPIVKTLLDGMRFILDELEISSPSRFAERMIGENIGEGLTRGVDSSLMGFSDTMLDQLNLSATTDAVAQMRSRLSSEIQAINRALQGIPDIDLEAKVRPVANGLGIDGDTLRVEAGPLNMNFHLTVTMEADQLATVLVDKASMVRKERI